MTAALAKRRSSTRPRRSRTRRSAATPRSAPAATSANSTLGDYSYCVENTQIAYATIGKFANIAAMCASMPACTRSSAPRCTISPIARPGTSTAPRTTQTSSTGAPSTRITIGHDTWIGHGAVDHAGRHHRQWRDHRLRRRGDPGRAGLCDRRRRAGQGHPAALSDDDDRERHGSAGWWDWAHDRLREALAGFPQPAAPRNSSTSYEARAVI